MSSSGPSSCSAEPVSVGSSLPSWLSWPSWLSTPSAAELEYGEPPSLPPQPGRTASQSIDAKVRPDVRIRMRRWSPGFGDADKAAVASRANRFQGP